MKVEEKAHWGSLEGACRSPGPAPSCVCLCQRGATCSKEHQPRHRSFSSCPQRGGRPWAPGIPRSEPQPPASSLRPSVKPRPSASPGPSDRRQRLGLLNYRNVLLPIRRPEGQGQGQCGLVCARAGSGCRRYHFVSLGGVPLTRALIPSLKAPPPHDITLGALHLSGTLSIHRTWPPIRRHLAKGRQLQVADG